MMGDTDVEIVDGTGSPTTDDGSAACVTCGTENRDGAQYCDSCGAFLGNDPAEDAPADNTPNVEDYDPERSAPRENLVRFRRSSLGAPSVMLRDATPSEGESGSLMFGYFSTFNDWYEIDSWYEGQFLERVAPGAYSQTIAEDRKSMRCLYDHGFDPVLGNKPLGPIQTLREDAIGPYYEVPLLDTDYNRNFVLPALRGQLMSGETVGSLLGASFRFIVVTDQWDRTGKVTDFNPKGLPLRTITQSKVLELGPVTFPANDEASAAARATTDGFVDRLRHDPVALARFTERSSSKVVERIIARAALTARPESNTTTTSAGPDGTTVRTRAQRRAKVVLHQISERS